MSVENGYYTANLSLLRAGKSELDALHIIMDIGLVNAGIGVKAHLDEDRFEYFVEESIKYAHNHNMEVEAPNEADQHIWDCALVGIRMLGISGCKVPLIVANWKKHHVQGQVFFKIKSDFLWNAIYTARAEKNQEIAKPYQKLSWREFRILVAILSVKLNSYGFAFIGWETIQARACGYHTKELYVENMHTLPIHCQPLTRSEIRTTTAKLERLGFFLRCRYSTGERGGYSAYSFRHKDRQHLLDDLGKIKKAKAENRSKIADNRALDLAAMRKFSSP